MKDKELFQKAIGMDPWVVVSYEFDSDKGRLDLELDFPPGQTFVCPECNTEGCKVYDTEKKSWRHLNFFQYEAYLHARVPRVDCRKCGVKLVRVPWARPGSGFTLLFEAIVMALAREMPIRAMSKILREHDTRLWRVLNHYVEEARREADFSSVREVGVDETSSKRGHNYVTLFVDLEKPRTMFVTEGKDASTLIRFKEDFESHKGDVEAIEEICCDMSPAFIAGVEKNFPHAQITFDKFHVLKVLNEAVDKVRREEQGLIPELKKTRYIWLKNPGNLKDREISVLESLQMKKLNLKTMRAYHIRLNFQELWNQTVDDSEQFLKKWYFWATHSRLEPIKEAAYTIKRHWTGILRWFKSNINNGTLEAFNSLVQAAKARARGYRTTKNLISMIYLITGKFNFNLPT
ncbi:MAG: ISL3 family transposase [Acidobacteria bacterium]|nr:ISL3 family transposase [Acidobacteriota bacterium]MCG2815215.1 ISL3 family transposase [Candidatus Aminicenantes bacterium]